MNRYDTDKSLTRRDGSIAFSPQGRAVADRRQSATSGRIHKVLGDQGPFTEEFKKAIHDDHEGILERIHLETELKAAKRIMKSLAKRPQESDCTDLLRDMSGKPTNRSKPCVLCPIWRHEHEMERIGIAMGRYLFPRVSGEVYLVSIIYDFASNLHELEEKLATAHKDTKKVIRKMTIKRRGVMMLGSFEPDLVDSTNLRQVRKYVELLRELKVEAPDAGGWVLTGHFVVRVPHKDDLKKLLDEQFPGRSWLRVRFDAVDKSKSLAQNMINIIGYAAKMPKPLFDIPTRGEDKKKADRKIGRMAVAFNGPQVNEISLNPKRFDVDAAIRQWALFMQRVGPLGIFFSIESSHAQKWFSSTEMTAIRNTDFDLINDGEHLIELHRDADPAHGSVTMPRLVGKVRQFRTRRLKHDPDWERLTTVNELDAGVGMRCP